MYTFWCDDLFLHLLCMYSFRLMQLGVYFVCASGHMLSSNNSIGLFCKDRFTTCFFYRESENLEKDVILSYYRVKSIYIGFDMQSFILIHSEVSHVKFAFPI